VVTDYGNNTCSVQSNATTLLCKNQLFGRDCSSLAGSLRILITNSANLMFGQYSINIGNFLRSLGLFNVVVIGGKLDILVNQTFFPVPIPLNLDILRSLEQVGRISIADFTAYNGLTGPAPVPRLTSITLQRLKSLAYFNVTGLLPPGLSVYSTAFNDMTSFRDLTCPPSQLILLNNAPLTSLAGLNNLATPLNATADVTIT
jgi:hypothetical protein